MKAKQFTVMRKEYVAPATAVYTFMFPQMLKGSADVSDDGSTVNGSDDDDSGDAWSGGHAKEFIWE